MKHALPLARCALAFAPLLLPGCNVFDPPELRSTDAGLSAREAGTDASATDGSMRDHDQSAGTGGGGGAGGAPGSDSSATGGRDERESGASGATGNTGGTTAEAGTDAAMGGRNPVEDGPWWIETNEHGCEVKRPPNKGDRPEFSDPGPELPPIYLATYRVRTGASADDEALSLDPNAWETIGFDLDGRCTNSPSCEKDEIRINERSCQNSAAVPYDGDWCIDNEIGKLFSVASSSPHVGELFGVTDPDFNCELHRGGFSHIIKISNYNGKKYDRDVRVDSYVSPGLQTLPGWKCRETIDAPLNPEWYKFANWLKSSHWKIARRSIDLAAPEAGDELPNSRTADPTAFVRNGYLYTELPDGREFWWNGQNTAIPGIRVIMHRPKMLGKLVKLPDDSWVLEDVIHTFVVLPDEMLLAFRELGLCENMCNSYELVKDYLNTHQDSFLTDEVLPDVPCSALSLASEFDARQVTLSKADIVDVDPPVECPQPRHPSAPRQGCVCQPDGTTCVQPDGGS